MFAAIDRGRTGRIGFGAFVEWLLTMTHGGAEDRLRYVSYHIIPYCTVLYCVVVYTWPACGVTFDRDPRPRGGPIAVDLCHVFIVMLYCNITLNYVIFQRVFSARLWVGFRP